MTTPLTPATPEALLNVDSHTLEPLTFPLWGSRLIEASAGTGKTWTIAALYLRLVLGHGGDNAFVQPLRPADTLVMTFTRAAPRELSDRIRARLRQAAHAFRAPAAVPPASRAMDRVGTPLGLAAALAAAAPLLLGLGLAAGSQGWSFAWGEEADLIAAIRAPRSLGALLAGALLGLAGAIAQGLFRNPLADPYLLGSAAGAGLGVVLVPCGGRGGGVGSSGGSRCRDLAGKGARRGAPRAAGHRDRRRRRADDGRRLTRVGHGNQHLRALWVLRHGFSPVFSSSGSQAKGSP